MTEKQVVIGVLTAKDYESRREACRDTWAGNLPSNVELVFLLGDPTANLPYRKGDTLYCPCPDDYPSLPQKTRWFCLWALANHNVNYLFKCDDDTYLAIDRLLESLPAQDYVGYDIQGYASGGAGYLLSRQAALLIAAHMQHKSGPEDLIAGKLLKEAGISFSPDARYHAWNNRCPRPDNDAISCHYVKPENMRRIHRRLMDGILPGNELYRLQAKHPNWRGEVVLFENGLMARPNGDGGEYEFEPQKTLLLRWDSWADELLLWIDEEQLYRSPDKDFTIQAVSCPTG